MNMHFKNLRILCICLASILLFGCASADSNSKAQSQDILCLGNSLIYRGELLQQYELLDKESNMFHITNQTKSGYTLDQHLADLSRESGDALGKYAIVILQEHGNPQLDTAGTVKKIMALFKSGTKFYYLVTEYDIKKGLADLAGIEGLAYIPSGYAHNLLLQDGFTYTQLHMDNDYHPNKLYGYVGALAMYSILTGKSCEGMPCDLLQTDPSLVPGYTAVEKENNISKIQKDVMKAVDTDIRSY